MNDGDWRAGGEQRSAAQRRPRQSRPAVLVSPGLIVSAVCCAWATSDCNRLRKKCVIDSTD